MKKILLTALAAFAIVSCSDDDNNSNTSLTGTWKLKSIIVPTPVDLNGDGQASNDLVKEADCMGDTYIAFPDDVAQATVSIQDIEIGEDTDGNSTVTCSEPEVTESTYTVTDNTVTLGYDGEQVTFTKTGKLLTVTQEGTTITFKKM